MGRCCEMVPPELGSVHGALLCDLETYTEPCVMGRCCGEVNWKGKE